MSVAGNGAPGLDAAEDASRQKQSEASVMDGSSSSKVTGAHGYCLPFSISLTFI